MVIAFHITFSRDTELDCTQHGGFVCGSDGKESTCNAGDLAWIPGLGRSSEEGMAAHSSILAWRIPWREETGGLQSVGSQRVGHDWETKHGTAHIQHWQKANRLFTAIVTPDFSIQ